MSLLISRTTEPERAILLELVRDPALVEEYEALAEPDYLEHKLSDPLCVPECTVLARWKGAPVGFGYAFALPSAGGGAWGALRIGVTGGARRRGFGSALHEALTRGLEAHAPPGSVRELAQSAWRPNEAAAAFAARHGYRHARIFWKMERPGASPLKPEWPRGVVVRVFDRSERAIADWNEAYNASFARHYRYVPSTLEHARQLAATPHFLSDGLALAYRDGRCVGFCRNERVGKEAEIGVLGVIPEAQGAGLGRALLRWGVAWFAARGEGRVALRVDGENESALGLYRSEGFEVARTRDLWVRTPAFAPQGPAGKRGARNEVV